MWHSLCLLFALWLDLVPVAFGGKTFCFPKGNCYIVNTTAVTFDNANITCGFKGFLASMKTQKEKLEIETLVTLFEGFKNMDKLWLGLYLPACVATDKTLKGFVWVSGGDTTEVNEWNSIPKPSCTTKKKCVILESKKNTSRPSAVTLGWRDAKCERKFAFICRSTEARHVLATTDIEMVTHSFTDQIRTSTVVTDQYTTQASITTQHSETSSSKAIHQVTFPCRTVQTNVTSSCTVAVYECNATHCLCGNVNDNRVLHQHITCEDMNTGCLQQCIKSMNICVCSDHHAPCEGEDCITELASSSETPVSSKTDLHSASSTSAPINEDDNLLDRLIIPLILGLVAFGILVMLVWGGVQMCIRKRKPKRRKSIIPAPPEASDTDSTEHSSSEEEEDEEEEGESQDRTEDQ